VKKWFYDRLKETDILVIYDKQGYIGLSLAAEIGAAYILNKPTIFLEEPSDAGIKAILKFSANFKVISSKKLVNELVKLKKRMEKA
jgi:hypothetical protein